MGSLKARDLVPGTLCILFLGLCVFFAAKVKPGVWHEKSMQLWQNEEWHKLRSLGDNLFNVGKEDVEAYYLAMHASAQMHDQSGVQSFANRLIETKALSWKLENDIAGNWQPESLTGRLKLYRARTTFVLAALVIVLLVLSLLRKDPYRVSTAVLSFAGIMVLIV